MTRADLPLADELRRVAGWNQSQRDWAGYLEFEPEGCFVAEAQGVRVGTATTIRYEGRVGWIGMVLVHPDQRRQGVGTALLGRAIGWLRERDIPCIKLDATPMGRNVYLPLGFRDEYAVTRFVGIAPAPAGELRPGIAGLQPEDLSAVADLDAQWFGVGRPRVLGALSARDPEYCFVARDGGNLVGYLIAREGAASLQVGPWAASNPDNAEALLQALFSRAQGRQVLLDVPGPNVAGAQQMARHGFSVQRGYTRMCLGENVAPGDPTKIHGTSGAEKG